MVRIHPPLLNDTGAHRAPVFCWPGVARSVRRLFTKVLCINRRTPGQTLAQVDLDRGEGPQAGQTRLRQTRAERSFTGQDPLFLLS